MANQPLFAANIDPTTADLDDSYARAHLADDHGLDMVTIQDHPYNRRFLDTMTLLTAIGIKTERVHLGTNVANLPLRPPVMLAKQVATLDVLTNGRVELGLGAGGFWSAITAFGGGEKTPGESFRAFEEAVQLIRALWDNAGHNISVQGEYYSVKGAQFGPAPPHRIPLWIGALGPKMLNLTGRLGDGIWQSSSYVPASKLDAINAQIDAGAAEANRSPDAIRRGYNLMGIIDFGQIGGRPERLQEGTLYGTPESWVDQLIALYRDHRIDTFNLWPVGDQPLRQLQLFADEIVPAVRAALA